ncbi:MAG TPA: DPP IV N-terminal domain-containing protein [Bacteroidia bacterium]|jgi:dipeptidyl-peptidase-4|nr:DPP IV N-terminal domain-containing protein [Bacteroidia bacterium]
MIKNVFSFVLVFFLSLNLFSQNKLLTIQDAVAKGRTFLAPKRLQNLSFIKGNDKFSYVDDNIVKVGDNATGKTIDFVSMTEINKILKAEKRDSLKQIIILEWKNEKQFYFLSGIVELIYDGNTKKVLDDDRKQNDKTLNSYDELNNDTYAFTKEDNNLYISRKGVETQITKDGSYTLVYGKTVHREEFGIDKGTFWSPGGNFLAFYRMDQSDVTDYPIIDWTKYPAENKNIKYPMAGNKSHYVTLGIYDMKTGKTWYVKTEGDREQYLTNIQWSPTEKHIYIAVLNRGQNDMKLNEYDVAAGNFVRTVFEEKDEKYTEPLHPVFFVKNEKQFIWLSRRDGYNHAYLYNIDGTLIKQLTKGKWEIKTADGFDESYSRFFFHANEQSSVNQDFYSVNIKGGEMTRLTTGNGFHTATMDKKGNYVMDNFSSCYVPREYFIINTKNKKSVSIFKAENPIKDYKLGRWSLFTIQNTEGTDLYCRIFKPVDFDSTKKYPVIVYLYNGPHSQMVTNTWLAGGELWYEYMAQKGFIIFTVDGRGTSWRGKDFEQSTFRQLGTKEMEDQLKGVDYLKSLPYVDGNRLGVFGWSFGGFMSTSLMTRSPGVYKVGVAGGPVIDWNYYEIMYGERYMDTPQENKEGYEKNNLLNYVDKLKGKLLMIHGTQDPVVVWQHSMKYLKKATDKGIQLDYYVYPGHEHNVLGKDRPHLMEKICNYFIDNL